MPIKLVTGDITDQPDLDAVVNAANAQLMPGGGVAGAIHRAAGSQLAEACQPLAPIAPGQAVITRGYKLPNPWIIHALGPRYGIDEPADRLLADAYRNALRLCEKKALASVGFPALSAGAFGYPLEEAAEIAMDTVRQYRPDSLQVRFVLFDDKTLAAFRSFAREG
ncbi:macro domain-containing protein [Wenzhouxiangella sp. AB-CW3]|uniref:macro domain-containing protein n=1 Tax=Wenzhouxiangella sp. AB-CW3 TaxID=2771012 RepID=UPI00168BD5D3|nr:macro domain-containing protein [Wenzhouxiangella sp. AB-CW3]QOC22627.1 macro domain-containing protein [Wenzhouxiangella sp. AB-CW3]